ncbi:methylenetetrahydrofolate reductase [NAD(P)H] [Desulfovibrio ferrophilus]|uniref:Methylenetetrahydrofolate reductase n=1 Tax=Desulfovibrio ferrophilus TaxID=241368 RepID=A0A2Z6AYE3_9BACT|nr:methylenetetrahydrofolate reductase [NAD(P)H] [Desulfovibrio ferrophilus]BBD08269.1 5,10-methylenetetrahydrofolate reductase [Desulfovibrio ferrophilus]
MRIRDLMQQSGKFISLEFFPPKDPKDWPAFFETVAALKAVDPLFVSVTYGAGGGTQDNTLEIVRKLRHEQGLTPMAHLTCVGASAEKLHGFLGALEEAGVENVLALRGDPPQGQECWEPDSEEFRHASDLVDFIGRHYPDMGVGVAGYPEGHPECSTFREDFEFLKFKLDAGADFAITQLFFDNRFYWNFLERLSSMGVNKPVIPGVLPIMSLQSAKRILSFCGANIPGKLLLDLEAADAEGGAKAAYKVGMDWAKSQVRGLLEGGAPGVHLYTLNRAEACLELVESLDPALLGR